MSEYSYEELMKMAIEHQASIIPDVPFYVKDLFQGTFWKDLSKGTRLGFGGYFKKHCWELEGVKYYGKAANNSALYIKKILMSEGNI